MFIKTKLQNLKDPRTWNAPSLCNVPAPMHLFLHEFILNLCFLYYILHFFKKLHMAPRGRNQNVIRIFHGTDILLSFQNVKTTYSCTPVQHPSFHCSINATSTFLIVAHRYTFPSSNTKPCVTHTSAASIENMVSLIPNFWWNLESSTGYPKQSCLLSALAARCSYGTVGSSNDAKIDVIENLHYCCITARTRSVYVKTFKLVLINILSIFHFPARYVSSYYRTVKEKHVLRSGKCRNVVESTKNLSRHQNSTLLYGKH